MSANGCASAARGSFGCTGRNLICNRYIVNQCNSQQAFLDISLSIFLKTAIVSVIERNIESTYTYEHLNAPGVDLQSTTWRVVLGYGRRQLQANSPNSCRRRRCRFLNRPSHRRKRIDANGRTMCERMICTSAAKAPLGSRHAATNETKASSLVSRATQRTKNCSATATSASSGVSVPAEMRTCLPCSIPTQSVSLKSSFKRSANPVSSD
jgi:hypothetical protein